MSVVPIITIPDKRLLQPCEKVTDFGSGTQKVIRNLKATLQNAKNPEGAGLAAPQIDKNMAIFIIKPTPEAKTEIFINPKIIKVEAGNPQGSEIKKKKKHRLEGCLSIPKIWGNVDRAHKVYLEFQDQTGKRHKKWFSGFKALIIQHEADHLRGVLFTQRALEQNQQLFEEKDGDLIPLRFQKEGVNT